MAVLLQIFSKLIIYTNYEINKKYITKEFCENKGNVKMHCNGKCYLMKQMKKEEKRENIPTNNIKEKYEIQIFSESGFSFDLVSPFTIIEHNIFYVISNSSSHLLAIFHPPSC